MIKHFKGSTDNKEIHSITPHDTVVPAYTHTDVYLKKKKTYLKNKKQECSQHDNQ